MVDSRAPGQPTPSPAPVRRHRHRDDPCTAMTNGASQHSRDEQRRRTFATACDRPLSYCTPLDDRLSIPCALVNRLPPPAAVRRPRHNDPGKSTAPPTTFDRRRERYGLSDRSSWRVGRGAPRTFRGAIVRRCTPLAADDRSPSTVVVTASLTCRRSPVPARRRSGRSTPLDRQPRENGCHGVLRQPGTASFPVHPPRVASDCGRMWS